MTCICCLDIDPNLPTLMQNLIYDVSLGTTICRFSYLGMISAIAFGIFALATGWGFGISIIGAGIGLFLSFDLCAFGVGITAAAPNVIRIGLNAIALHPLPHWLDNAIRGAENTWVIRPIIGIIGFGYKYIGNHH